MARNPYLPETVKATISRQFRNFERNHKKLIPITSKNIIRNAINAIVDDPSPLWVGNQSRTAVQQQIAQQLDALLEEIAAISPTGDDLNTFLLLHSISTILDRICPFDKVPPANANSRRPR